METANKTAEPDEARLAEVDYHRRQNRLVVYVAAPSMIFYAGFYFYLSAYFHSSIFILMFINAAAAIIVSRHLKDIKSLTVHKRITAGIAFALLAANLLVGLWDENIYYVVLPWIFIYPMTTVMFFGRKLGFIIATAFSIVALVFVLVNDMPPWDARHIKMFQYNMAGALLSSLVMSVIYEKTRMKVQDELAVSQNAYRLAELHQRETNLELQQEIERRKQTEKALAESELHYRALFEESVVPLWEESWPQVKTFLDDLPPEAHHHLVSYFHDNPQAIEKYIPCMHVTAVNRATLKLCNADSQSTLFRNLSQLIASDMPGFVVQRMVSLYLTGRYDAELIGTTLTGRKLHLLVSSMIPAGYEDSWEKIFNSVYDATDRVAMEEEKKRVDQQMQNARQIQAIATLAGGIAHQFNNALAAIYGNLDLLEMNTPENTGNRKILTSLKTSSSRMSSLTDQLLAYAEGGKYQPQKFSINDLVIDLIHSRAMPAGNAIQVISQLGGDIFLAEGDVTQIKMVVDVVLSNAFEALQKGGIVKISTGRRLIGEAVTKNDPPARQGVYTFIRIEDNGIGMTDETLQRIFEPFFTTKIYGRGLGMAAAFGIIKNHDGLITVDSEPGQGTIVVIYLPGIESQAT
ncbi:MAG: hypothetical protein K4571_00355 [Deltaproteobacteria bacterium]